MNNLYLGRHISIDNIIETIDAYGYNIIQIFLVSPHKISPNKKKKEELLKIKTILKQKKILLVIHGSYAANLSHPDGSYKKKMSIKSLVQDLISSSIIGKRCIGVIVHMGKNVATNNIPEAEAIQNYIDGINDVLFNSPVETTLIIETGASQGTEIPSNISQLANIYHAIIQKKRIKFCIDTCHIWASGHNIGTKIDAKKYFKKFNSKIGINKIACIHFNNSKTALGSKIDRHADLEYGLISSEGLQTVAKIAKHYSIPLIMETPLESFNKKTNTIITESDEIKTILKWTNHNNKSQ